MWVWEREAAGRRRQQHECARKCLRGRAALCRTSSPCPSPCYMQTHCTPVTCPLLRAGFIGVKLCPHLIFVPPSFDKYQCVSERTRAVFARYDPAFEAGSLDEAYLDVTAYCAEHGATGEG